LVHTQPGTPTWHFPCWQIVYTPSYNVNQGVAIVADYDPSVTLKLSSR
jgi:hypothetical protein